MSVKRQTKSVIVIKDLFKDATKAMSVVELVETFKGRMNKTTVYRVLERLEGEGIIHSFTGTKGLKWYAKCSSCSHHMHNDTHPHFECKDCGKMECLDVDIAIPQLQHLTVDSVNIILKGQCSDCKD